MSASLAGRLGRGEHEPRLSTRQLLTRQQGIRFNIDIHPEGTRGRLSAEEPHVERVMSRGVETLVYAAGELPAGPGRSTLNRGKD